jgi:hypothetical protein
MRFQLTSKKWYCQGPQADGTHKQGGIGGCVPEAALPPPSAETKIPGGFEIVPIRFPSSNLLILTTFPDQALPPPSAETKIPRGVRNRAHPIPIFQPIIADFSRSTGFVGHSGPSGYSIPAIALI